MAPRKKKTTEATAPKTETNAYIAGAGTIVEQQVSETLKSNLKRQGTVLCLDSVSLLIYNLLG